MITIRFTQCWADFEQDELSEAAARLPVIPRLARYRGMLQAAERAGGGEFSTLDEHLLLMAQAMRRRSELARLRFVDWCGCAYKTGRVAAGYAIDVDADGDMEGGGSAHGFFPQRLGLLRPDGSPLPAAVPPAPDSGPAADLFHANDPAAPRHRWNYVYLRGAAEDIVAEAAASRGWKWAPTDVFRASRPVPPVDGEYPVVIYGRPAIAVISSRSPGGTRGGTRGGWVALADDADALRHCRVLVDALRHCCDVAAGR